MTLLLDPDIRDWVVLPLFVIMIAAGLLRHSVGQLLASPKAQTPVSVQRTQHLMKHCLQLRSRSQYMTSWKWNVKRQQYARLFRDQADWLESHQDESADANADDPMAAFTSNPLAMMKGNMAFMVQNMIMMQGIQHFFSGFILLKVPFPLTVGFKSMFQKGLADLPDLEPSYVSSVSWYFLVMYGLRSFFRLVVGDASLEQREQDLLLQQMGLRHPPPPGGKSEDAEALAKQLRQEAENMELFWQAQLQQQAGTDTLDSIEKRLLRKRYPKKKKTAVSGDDAAEVLLLGGKGGRGVKAKKKKQ